MENQGCKTEDCSNEGLENLSLGLDLKSNSPEPFYENTTNPIESLFLAGLNQGGRLDKIGGLVRVYTDYDAQTSLGEALIQHVGRLYRTGEPFPSSDNLDGWVSAWETASKNMPEFARPLCLLRTGVAIVKTGGNNVGVLLTLTLPERAILEQAFGLVKGD